MFWFFDKYEREMRRGNLSPSTFRKLWDAECYGAASSMGYLQTELHRLKSLISSGGFTVSIKPGHRQVIASQDQFYDWVATSFPDAYKCFFERSRSRG